MFTRPRSRFTVADADAVAITEMRLAAMATRMGTPRARVSSGTRKTPPPEAEHRAHEAGGGAGHEQQERRRRSDIA